jgi:hypothetical protein
VESWTTPGPHRLVDSQPSQAGTPVVEDPHEVAVAQAADRCVGRVQPHRFTPGDLDRLAVRAGAAKQRCHGRRSAGGCSPGASVSKSIGMTACSISRHFVDGSWLPWVSPASTGCWARRMAGSRRADQHPGRCASLS